MQTMSYADELAEIRAEIARLKAREASLRAHFLRDPETGANGRWTRVEVVEMQQTRFNPALLPEDILKDRRYHEDRLVRAVRCLPAQLTVSVRPGWPILRERGAIH